MSRVRCLRCSEIYNLENVEIVARYGDCTVYTTPCCNQQVDDRKWAPAPAYRELSPDEAARDTRRRDPNTIRPDRGPNTIRPDRGHDWRHHAACLDEDPELFFPIGAAGPAQLQIEEAKAVCRRCPVIDDCARWAIETGEEAGVWGGLSEDERRAIKRRAAKGRGRPRTPAPAADPATAPGKPKRATGCGTMPGWRRHKELHERFCDPCKTAKRSADAKAHRRQLGRTEQAA